LFLGLQVDGLSTAFASGPRKAAQRDGRCPRAIDRRHGRVSRIHRDQLLCRVGVGQGEGLTGQNGEDGETASHFTLLTGGLCAAQRAKGSERQDGGRRRKRRCSATGTDGSDLDVPAASDVLLLRMRSLGRQEDGTVHYFPTLRD